jgi:hypothetical protein
MQSIIRLLVVLLFPIGVYAQSDKSLQNSLRTAIETLAADRMEGRGTGTPGERLASQWIADQFRSIGLKPMGPLQQYAQPFLLKQGLEIMSTTCLQIGNRVFAVGDEFFPMPFSSTDTINLTKGTSQCLLMDVSPMAESLKTNPHGDLSDLIYQRCEVLAKKYPGHLLMLYDNRENGEMISFDAADKHERLSAPVMFAKKPLIDHLRSVAGNSIQINGRFQIEPRLLNTANLVGMIDNGAPQTIVIGAHLDHLGWGDHHSLYSGKESMVHNGADDNASGVAMMLTLAKWLKKKSFRSSNYLFIAFSGEELGLLGSKYFVEHSPIDLKSIRYMINLDMVGRLNDSTQALTVGGFGTSPVWSTLIAPDEAGMRIKIDSAGAGPSDHTSFYRKNIPVLFFFTGVHGDYHKPSDDVEKINVPGMVRITRLIEKVISKSLLLPNIPFSPTRENTMGKASFKVSLGIMPDYAFDGEGVRVDGLSENKPAQKAGILAGDIIISLNEHPIKNINQYMQALGRYRKGDDVTVGIKRKDTIKTLNVTF